MTADIQFNGFGIANYRSFDEEGVFLSGLQKINFLIGKNNCGKSNLLRFLGQIGSAERQNRIKWDQTNDHHRGSDSPPIVSLAVPTDGIVNRQQFTEQVPHFFVKVNAHNGEHTGENTLSTVPVNGQEELRFYKRGLDDVLLKMANRHFRTHAERSDMETEVLKELSSRVWHSFYKFAQNQIYVPHFREVSLRESISTAIDGSKVITELHEMQHPDPGHENKQETFHKLKSFLVELLGELRLEVSSKADSIILNMHGLRKDLSSFGTGIHELVILCSAMAIHEDRLFLIEEPELHLHPEMQRRFLQFMRKMENQYIITTHSNVFLDTGEDISIYHVRYDGNRSTIDKSLTNGHSREALTDLGYKASDLLQSNGIIWVEGPSDRVYVNRWLELSGSDFIEGIHYSIMFYGGALLAHLTAADGTDEDFVELLNINPNAIVIIDSDRRTDGDALREYKERIESEIGSDNCWITHGKEIENYLNPNLVKRFLENQFDIEGVDFKLATNGLIQSAIGKALTPYGKKLDYDRKKVERSRQIAEIMTKDDLNVHDLDNRLKKMLEQIAVWNQVPPED